MAVIHINEADYGEILQQAVAVLPWGHNLLLIEKINDEKGMEYQLLLPKESLQTLVLNEINTNEPVNDNE